MITQQKASVLPAHIFKNISLGVIVCSLTTRVFLVKSLLRRVFWNRAAMPNSVEKGTAVLWLKSSQLKLCFCFGKRKKNLKHRELFWRATQGGHLREALWPPASAPGALPGRLAPLGYRGWTLCSPSPSLETLGTRRLVSP